MYLFTIFYNIYYFFTKTIYYFWLFCRHAWESMSKIVDTYNNAVNDMVTRYQINLKLHIYYGAGLPFGNSWFWWFHMKYIYLRSYLSSTLFIRIMLLCPIGKKSYILFPKPCFYFFTNDRKSLLSKCLTRTFKKSKS